MSVDYLSSNVAPLRIMAELRHSVKTTLSIITLSNSIKCHYAECGDAECYNAECHYAKYYLSALMISVIFLNDDMLNIV